MRPSAGPAAAPTPFPVPAWEDRTLGPHQVPAIFQRTSRDRFVAGPALDAFTVHRLGLPDAFLGDRFLAPSLEGLSAEHLAAVLRGTHDSVWVAGVTALDASVLPPPRSDAGLAVSLPDLTGLSDADLRQLDQRTHTLMLDGLPSLSARQVALLGSAEPARATGRGEAPPDALLSLRGVGGLTPADLAALASANRSLWLSFPDGLGLEAAEAVVGGAVRALHLSGLPRVSEDEAAVLVDAGLESLFLEVDTLDAATAAVLAGFQGRRLELAVHGAVSPAAARALASLVSGGPRFKETGKLVVTVAEPPSLEALAALGQASWLAFRGPRPLAPDEVVALAGSGRHRSLGPVEHVDASAAAALAALVESGATVALAGVVSASAEAIEAGLGTWIDADDLRRIDAGAAAALARRGETRFRLEALAPAAAAALVAAGRAAWKPNATLSVHSDTRLSAETLAALGQFRSEPNAFRRLEISAAESFSAGALVALAEACAAGGPREGCGLTLGGLADLDAPLAEALGGLAGGRLVGVQHVAADAYPHLCRLHLDGERDLELRSDAELRAYAAWKTCQGRTGRIQLDRLPGLTVEGAAVLAGLSEHVALTLPSLEVGAAAALAQVPRLWLTLEAPLEPAAAAALAGASGDLRLSLEGALGAETAAALAPLSPRGGSLTLEALPSAEALGAFTAGTGTVPLVVEADPLSPALAAVLPRHRGAGTTTVSTPGLSRAAAEALQGACADRGGCGALDLGQAEASAADTLAFLVETWPSSALVLPGVSQEGDPVPCTRAPQIDTPLCEQGRAMQAFEHHDHDHDDEETGDGPLDE